MWTKRARILPVWFWWTEAHRWSSFRRSPSSMLNTFIRESDRMNRQFWFGLLGDCMLSAGILATLVAPAGAQGTASQPEPMPSGQIITPLAPPGAVFSKLNPGLKDFPGYTVGQAVKTAMSP